MIRAGLIAVTLVLASGLRAEPVDDLAEALRIDDLLSVIRDEGLENAADILPKSPSGEVSDVVMQAALDAFELETMQAEMRDALSKHLSDEMMEKATVFFTSDVGHTLINMELSARRAIMDPQIEDVARANWQDKSKDEREDPHFAAILRFARVNDLVARNAAGTMVARYEFLLGLAQGSGQAINEDAALADIWAREDQILEESEDWLMAFLLLAYGPVPTEHVEAYTAFSRRPAGAALNDALFDGFEVTFRRISYELGRISGHATSAQDL